MAGRRRLNSCVAPFRKGKPPQAYTNALRARSTYWSPGKARTAQAKDVLDEGREGENGDGDRQRHPEPAAILRHHRVVPAAAGRGDGPVPNVAGREGLMPAVACVVHVPRARDRPCASPARSRRIHRPTSCMIPFHAAESGTRPVRVVGPVKLVPAWAGFHTESVISWMHTSARNLLQAKRRVSQLSAQSPVFPCRLWQCNSVYGGCK